MIAIVDYGMANLRSVEKALLKVGADPRITSDPSEIARADKLVLPGVGAFCAAMSNLHQGHLDSAVVKHIAQGKPFLGICLGLQMLFDSSTEMGSTPGLGVLHGKVIQFFEDGLPGPEAAELKVPHIGWNGLNFPRASRLLHGLEEGAQVYFVHSYFPVPDERACISATSDYGYDFCCAVEKDNIAATQFHPEKSGTVGLQILRNFASWD